MTASLLDRFVMATQSVLFFSDARSCCTTQLVLAVPKGVALMAVMDCCCSGTIFDLPYHKAGNDISAGKDY